jgi:hypothetical protein
MPPSRCSGTRSAIRASPALLRIGEHVAELLVALPPGLDPGTVHRAAREGLRTPRVSPESVAAIAEAVAKLSQAKAARPDPPR